MGFVKRQGGVAHGVAAPVPHVDTATQTSGPTPINEFDLFALAATPTVELARQAPNAFELELQALATQVSATQVLVAANAQAPTPSIRQPVIGPEPAKPDADKPILAELLREMDRFLSESAGADALPISLMLEQITSLAQLRRELPQYQELVVRYGPASGPHLERLTTLLAKAGV